MQPLTPAGARASATRCRRGGESVAWNGGTLSCNAHCASAASCGPGCGCSCCCLCLLLCRFFCHFESCCSAGAASSCWRSSSALMRDTFPAAALPRPTAAALPPDSPSSSDESESLAPAAAWLLPGPGPGPRPRCRLLPGCPRWCCSSAPPGSRDFRRRPLSLPSMAPSVPACTAPSALPQQTLVKWRLDRPHPTGTRPCTPITACPHRSSHSAGGSCEAAMALLLTAHLCQPGWLGAQAQPARQ